MVLQNQAIFRNFAPVFLWVMKVKIATKHRIIAIFLAMLMVVYVGNVSCFVHKHKVGDVTIVHSHPFTSSSHSHTATSLTTLSLISHFCSLPVAEAVETETFLQLLRVLILGDVVSSECGDVLSSSLRAPPVL